MTIYKTMILGNLPVKFFTTLKNYSKFPLKGVIIVGSLTEMMKKGPPIFNGIK